MVVAAEVECAFVARFRMTCTSPAESWSLHKEGRSDIDLLLAPCSAVGV